MLKPNDLIRETLHVWLKLREGARKSRGRICTMGPFSRVPRVSLCTEAKQTLSVWP